MKIRIVLDVLDESVGEVSTVNGTVIRCRAHADTAR